jgi:CheY-like chemotaxis protein
VQKFVGGRSVAKILVADDNSNIQKMVGLALKDQGIDVVAVGNGEAAVRKISDLRPDLVLADVFMPVRNGYEVCQYVKADPSLAHIPVILLVGAFDPLDEQEAQRVGADGVLKKPFVPPDPLISMVKSALQRAGVAQGTSSAAKTPEPEAMKASDLLRPMAPAIPAIPTLVGVPVQTTSHEPSIAALEQESFVDEVPERPAPVRIDGGSQTVAFGSLLETPAEEKQEDDIAFMPAAHADLVPERDWRDPDAEETDEGEEEEKPAAPWRPEAAESYPDAGAKGGAKDWRSGSFEQILARKSQEESWEPAEEKAELVEAAPAANSLVSEAPAAPASVPEATAHAGTISPTPFMADAWTAPSSPAAQEESSAKAATAVEEVGRMKDLEPKPAETVIASAPEVTPSEPPTKTSKEPWFSVPANPWNAEIEKANRLASAWDAAAPVPAGPAAPSDGAAEAVSDTTQKVIQEAALPPAAVEAIREEAAQVAQDATHSAGQQANDGTNFYAPEELLDAPAAAPAAAPTASMEDLVARVLARMSPEVLQAVTREILKPVVEAMVKEEMKSKKS